MQGVVRVFLLVSALAGVIMLLIGVPAVLGGVFGEGRIQLVMVGYFLFFLGTIWRVLRYGELVDRTRDEQVKETGGQVAALITTLGLLGFHWLAVYEFAQRSATPFSLLDGFWIGSGLLLIGSGIAVSQVAIRTLGKFFDRLVIKSDHRLVTEGIYSSIRHPIYTSYILLFLGYCAMLQSCFGLGVLALVCVVWFGNRIAIEERMLEGRFGEEYRVYCQGTKRLFPYLY